MLKHGVQKGTRTSPYNPEYNPSTICRSQSSSDRVSRAGPDDMEPRQTAWKTPAKRSSTVSSRQPIEMIRTKAQKKWPSSQVIGQVVVSGRNLEHICSRIESRRQRSSCRRPHAAVIVRYAIISRTAMYFLDKFISEESHIISAKKTPAFSWCFLKIKLQGILLLIIMPARA